MTVIEFKRLEYLLTVWHSNQSHIMSQDGLLDLLHRTSLSCNYTSSCIRAHTHLFVLLRKRLLEDYFPQFSGARPTSTGRRQCNDWITLLHEHRHSRLERLYFAIPTGSMWYRPNYILAPSHKTGVELHSDTKDYRYRIRVRTLFQFRLLVHSNHVIYIQNSNESRKDCLLQAWLHFRCGFGTGLASISNEVSANQPSDMMASGQIWSSFPWIRDNQAFSIS